MLNDAIGGSYTPVDTLGGNTDSQSTSFSADETITANVDIKSESQIMSEQKPEYEHEAPQRESGEGPSSRLPSQQNSTRGPVANNIVDLELQNGVPVRDRLATGDRVKNVIKYFFPFKQTYERLSNGLSTGRLQSNAPGRFVGQGTDGVFRNLMAKPDTESIRAFQEQYPPTYEEAAADSSPEYWEATIISPMYEDEVFIQGLPVGNVANFVWNVMVTVAFQLVGFVLCYLLHTSHAAKQGTRAGLGVTIFMYGYNAIPANFGRADRVPIRYVPSDPNIIDVSKSSSIKTGGAIDTYSSVFSQNSEANETEGGFESPLLAYSIICFGIILFVKALTDFNTVKKEEKQILSPQATEETHTTTETVSNPPPT